MDVFAIDTHALAWFFAEDARLSPKVDSILVQAEATTAQILIPTLVLAELTLISQKQRVPITIAVVLETIQETALLNESMNCPHPQPFSPRRREPRLLSPRLLGEG